MSYVGECNGCGVCCRAMLAVPEMDAQGNVTGQRMVEFRCRNLVVTAGMKIGEPPDADGTPATRCRIHDRLYPGMPIEMEAADGSGWLATSTCISDYPRPQAAIGEDSRWKDRYGQAPADAIPPECSYRWEAAFPGDEQPKWHPNFLPVEQICNTSVLCPVEHRCVVCGGLALAAGHQRRVTCPHIFVRCTVCSEAKRVPDSARFAGWWEVATAENMSGKAADGRTVFFEVM